MFGDYEYDNDVPCCTICGGELGFGGCLKCGQTAPIRSADPWDDIQIDDPNFSNVEFSTVECCQCKNKTTIKNAKKYWKLAKKYGYVICDFCFLTEPKW